MHGSKHERTRDAGGNARALGTNPRALGTNPRSARKRRNSMKEEFVEFLTAYPNSSDGASAYAEYVLARKDATASELLRAARRYAHNTRFAKADCLPESGRWLQERRWHNDIRTTPDEPKLLAEVLAIGRIALGLERAAPEAEE